MILIYTNQNSESIGREPDHAASGLLQELIKFGCECSSAVWCEATLQGRMPARPTCAPSRLIQAQTDRTPAGLLGGVERSDITEVTSGRYGVYPIVSAHGKHENRLGWSCRIIGKNDLRLMHL